MSYRGIAGGATLLLMLAAVPAEAAWNNAFQVTCFGCRNRASRYYAPPPQYVAGYAAPVVAASPGPCCHTSYVQRSFYMPVTTYKTVLEPVQSQRTSYYWEPVCSYRSSCYHDPCTGASVQVTQPVTSYRLRSQCNTVTSYVQRCVPVTSYRIAHRLEPVTVCPPPDPCAAGTPVIPGGPNVHETPMAPGDTNLPPTRVDETPGQPGSRNKPAGFRMDKVVGNPGRATVRGQLVASNFVTPLRGAKVIFVSKQSETTQQAATADAIGRFAVGLPAGGWKIYLSRADGSLDYHSSIDVRESQLRDVMVVSR